MFDALTDFLYSIYEQYIFLPFYAKFGIAVTVAALIVFCVIFGLRKRKRRHQKNSGITITPIPVAQPETAEPPELHVVGETAEPKPEITVFDAPPSHGIIANILIIEDDLIMLLAIKNILSRSGYNLVTAQNGKEAFEELEKGVYDIVITDLMMPYANGLEVVSMIRNDDTKRHMGIIVCSSVGNEETITEAFRLGADDYIKKPVKTDDYWTEGSIIRNW